jgi:hypothetical protein
MDQATVTSELPETVAVKGTVPPVGTVAVVGDRDTLTTGVADTAITATELLVASAWLVATTWQAPPGTVAGAVYTPPWVTEPHPEASWIDQITATSVLPETVAVNVAVPPVETAAVVGDSDTLTTGVADTVTTAMALFVASAWLVAATWQTPAGRVIGAL